MGLALAGAALVAAAMSAGAAAPLDDELLRVRDAAGVPALAGMVFRHGAVVNAAAVGVRKAGDATPVSIDDRFHLGSDTKAMTATLVAMLVDRHALSWTSTLAELLPDVPMDPAFASVTVEMLLAHRSGLGSEVAVDGGTMFRSLREPGLDPVDARRRFARTMLAAPPTTPPGSAFGYANANYVIAGHIVERLEGRSWEAAIRALLFEPLGMASCGFGPAARADAPAPDAPWAHRTAADGWSPVLGDNPAALGPAGTVHCSLRDWTRFVALQMDAFNGHPRLVSAASFAKLHAHIDGQEYTCGGWIRTERPWADGIVFTHDGSNGLNYATVWWAPGKDTAVLAVSNAGPPGGQKAARDAVPALLKVAGLL